MERGEEMKTKAQLILFAILMLILALTASRLYDSIYANGYNQCISEMRDLGVRQ